MSADPAGSTPVPLPPARGSRVGVLQGCLVGAGAVALTLVAAAFAVIWAVGGALDRLNPFDDLFDGPLVEETTIDRSGPAVLTALTDLGEFRAASGYYEVVVDLETDVDPLPSFLAGERVLFVAAGSVDAAVDLTGLEPGAVTVDEERTSATVVLPPPVLTDPELDLDRSYVVSRDRGLVDRLQDALGEGGDGDEATRELYVEAEDRLAEAAARTDELPQRARTNTRATLESLLTSLGFTDVTVRFSDE